MYSLGTRTKLEAERDQSSSREILWKNLRDRKKYDRMVHRIYGKTREEMVQSCRSRCHDWVTDATEDIGSWVRDPQLSVFQHTFRDRQPHAEIGTTNGHVSGRKYIPRLVFGGGGKLDEKKTDNLNERFMTLSRMRGNDPCALQNPCRPTVIVTDTAKIRGRLEQPHWGPPKYVLRPREKAKEIGPDIQYADRNDMQRIFSGVVRNSLFHWGEYREGGPYAAPSCRQERREKWVTDQEFNPGFRFRDCQRETMAGTTNPRDLLNIGAHNNPAKFARERCPAKELPRHGRFCSVVRDSECICPDGNTRRSLSVDEEFPEAYPEGKMYFASLRAVPFNPTTKQNPRSVNSSLPGSGSLGSLLKRPKKWERGKVAAAQQARKTPLSETEGDEGEAHRLLPRAKSCTTVRFFPGFDREGHQQEGNEGIGENSEQRLNAVSWEGRGNIRDEARNATVSAGMRRESEVADWATCGATDKSARSYLW